MLFDSIFMFRIDEEECIIPTTVLTMHCIIHGPHKANCTSTCVCKLFIPGEVIWLEVISQLFAALLLLLFALFTLFPVGSSRDV